MPEEGVVLQPVAAAARWQFGYKGKSCSLSEPVLFIASLVGESGLVMQRDGLMGFGSLVCVLCFYCRNIYPKKKQNIFIFFLVLTS